MDTITPIQTIYNGYRFRSRLEARWAVFFDAIGMKYEYEPEGYDLGDGVRYLPDFYLPEVHCFAEVKANEPTEAELDKMRRLVLLTEDNEEPIGFASYLFSTIKGIFLIGIPDYGSNNQIIEMIRANEYNNISEKYKKYIETTIDNCDVDMFIYIASNDIFKGCDFSPCIDALKKKIQEREKEENDGEAEYLLAHLELGLEINKIKRNSIRSRRVGISRYEAFWNFPTRTGCIKARQARFEHGETPVPGK
jgi:hypothetical protein